MSHWFLVKDVIENCVDIWNIFLWNIYYLYWTSSYFLVEDLVLFNNTQMCTNNTCWADCYWEAPRLCIHHLPCYTIDSSPFMISDFPTSLTEKIYICLQSKRGTEKLQLKLQYPFANIRYKCRNIVLMVNHWAIVTHPWQVQSFLMLHSTDHDVADRTSFVQANSLQIAPAPTQCYTRGY